MPKDITYQLSDRTLAKLKDIVGESGGSIIVDALPADGVEGQTYLLRKVDESSTFKAHFYKILYCTLELPYGNELLVGNGDVEIQLEDALYKKLNPELAPEYTVNFATILPQFTALTPTEFEDWISRYEEGSITIVQTEEDVLALGTDYSIIIQDLGEIGVENLIVDEVVAMSETFMAEMYGELPNTLTNQVLINDNNQEVFRTRELQYRSELGPGDTYYYFTEWNDIYGNLVGTLTDTYEYDRDVLSSLQRDDIYRINLTPETPTYSYTQYVFDKGVYTEISAKSNDAELIFRGEWLNPGSGETPNID